jgi:GDP-L-fucose synthase
MSFSPSILAPGSRIYVAGHRGMVGSALVRLLRQRGHKNIMTRTSAELDLCSQNAVSDFFRHEKIDYVVLAAARVGGIHANNVYPAEFIYQNLMIQNNVIHQAFQAGIEHLLFLGSSCIYPKFTAQPMREEQLLTGILEPTNEPYAIAKIAGIKMCESYNRQYGSDYRAVMPTNLYGPGDNFHLENSHVIPAILRKYHLARLAAEADLEAITRDEQTFGAIPTAIRNSLGLAPADGTIGIQFKDSHPTPFVQLWGSGTGRREFLHVDDMAAACYHVMSLDKKTYSGALSNYEDSLTTAAPTFINIGTGSDCMIREVADIMRELVGFAGETRYDSEQPDGTPQKLLDTGRINALGWQPGFSLQEGLADAYRWYCSRTASKRGRSSL